MLWERERIARGGWGGSLWRFRVRVRGSCRGRSLDAIMGVIGRGDVERRLRWN